MNSEFLKAFIFEVITCAKYREKYVYVSIDATTNFFKEISSDDIEKHLLLALLQEYTEKLESLLKNGVALTGKWSNYLPVWYSIPLFHSVCENRLVMLTIVLEYSLDISIKNLDDENRLRYISYMPYCSDINLQVAEILTNARVPLDEPDQLGWSLLYYAIIYSCVHLTRFLLTKTLMLIEKIVMGIIFLYTCLLITIVVNKWLAAYLYLMELILMLEMVPMDGQHCT